MHTQEELDKMSEQELEAMVSQWVSEEQGQMQAQEVTPEEGEAQEPATTPEEPAEVVEGEPTKPGSSAPRYLRQNNELKQQLAERDAEIERLKSESWGQVDEELINAIVEKKLAEERLSQDKTNSEASFYQSNPKATEYKDDIQAMAEEHPTLSIDAIYKLVLAEKAPEELLDEQSRNRMSTSNSLKGRDGNNAPSRKDSDPSTWTDKEQEEYINKTYSFGGGY